MIVQCASIDDAVTRSMLYIKKGYRVKDTSAKHIELEATPRANLSINSVTFKVSK